MAAHRPLHCYQCNFRSPETINILIIKVFYTIILLSFQKVRFYSSSLLIENMPLPKLRYRFITIIG